VEASRGHDDGRRTNPQPRLSGRVRFSAVRQPSTGKRSAPRRTRRPWRSFRRYRCRMSSLGPPTIATHPRNAAQAGHIGRNPDTLESVVRLPARKTAGVLALIDFGSTLAEETFMRRDSESFPTWTSTWLRTMTKARADWDTGRLSWEDLAGLLAAELGCSAQEVREYMLELCRRIDFYPAINAAVRRRRALAGQVLASLRGRTPALADVVTDSRDHPFASASRTTPQRTSSHVAGFGRRHPREPMPPPGRRLPRPHRASGSRGLIHRR
jgi:hypothetical protein